MTPDEDTIRERSTARQLEARKRWRTDEPEGPPDPPEREATRAWPNPAETVNGMGLVRHPAPYELASELESTAELLRRHGKQAQSLARALHSPGWPDGTSGGRGGGMTIIVDDERVPVTSVEAAAFSPGRAWDADLAEVLRSLHDSAQAAHNLIAQIVSHGSDDDPTPAGTGECKACGMFVRPTGKRPSFRLRAQLCPRDHKAWERAGKPERSTWIRDRRAELTDDRGVLHEAREA